MPARLPPLARRVSEVGTVTGLAQIVVLATAILGLTFLAARGLREAYRAVEQYRADVAQADAVDAWDAVVTDAQLVVAYGRHPASQRRSVAGLWRAMYPRERVHPIVRLIGGDQ